VLALSFGIGIMLAAVSGGLIATILSFTILSGSAFQLKSFVIVVLGGLGNPTGALLGGIILGLLEGLIPVIQLPLIGSIPFGWVPVIEYVIFVMILLVRPKGLLGART
jgi:branched-subunit amino acid ABC-type transport system permease component